MGTELSDFLTEGKIVTMAEMCGMEMERQTSGIRTRENDAREARQ